MTENNIVIPKLIRVKELAQTLSISRTTVEVLLADGTIPKAAYLIGGGRVRAWTMEQVAAILESMRNPQATA